MGASKIATLFHRVQEILQCHTLFRLALSECVRSWDKEEKIGDVFVASFSKAVVLDIYSDFINNFSLALDVAKQESKRKSALADFLKVIMILQLQRARVVQQMLSRAQIHLIMSLFDVLAGQTDFIPRPAILLWSHGQTRTKISAIYSPTSG